MSLQILQSTKFLVAVFFSALSGVLYANATSPTAESVMTMTTSAPSIEFSLAGSGNATIDWGDGSEIETFSISEEQIWILRDFLYRDRRTITITGSNITLLDCSENALTALDVSRNPALQVLSCYDNRLTALNLNQNTVLKWVDCSSNQLTADALNALFASLQNYAFEKIIIISDNPGASDCLPNIAEIKGWTVDGYTGKRSMTMTFLGDAVNAIVEFRLAGTGTATIDWGDGSEREVRLHEEYYATYRKVYSEPTRRTITISGENITGFWLVFIRELIVELDVSQNRALTDLRLYNGRITTIDVRQNTALQRLEISGQLTTIDVSRNEALTYLDLQGNQLTALDLSQNSALTFLSIRRNFLTALDLSQNTELTQIDLRDNPLNVSALIANPNLVIQSDVTSRRRGLSSASRSQGKLRVGVNPLIYGIYHNDVVSVGFGTNITYEVMDELLLSAATSFYTGWVSGRNQILVDNQTIRFQDYSLYAHAPFSTIFNFNRYGRNIFYYLLGIGIWNYKSQITYSGFNAVAETDSGTKISFAFGVGANIPVRRWATLLEMKIKSHDGHYGDMHFTFGMGISYSF